LSFCSQPYRGNRASGCHFYFSALSKYVNKSPDVISQETEGEGILRLPTDKSGNTRSASVRYLFLQSKTLITHRMERVNSISGAIISEELIVEYIRSNRNDIVKDFLDERNIRSYYADRYHLNDIESPKVHAIKVDLKELLDAPVDTEHYNSLIQQMKQAGIVSLDNVDINPDLYYKEIQKIFLKHMF
jgi:hypothetical protein